MTDESRQEPRYEGDAIVLNTRVDRLENEAAEAAKRDEKYKDAALGTNRSIARFTGLLVLCSVVTAGIGIWQARVANRAAVAAQHAADAASSNANISAYALEQSQWTSDFTLTQMENQTTAQQVAANAAKGANEIANKTFALVHRPWVGVDVTSDPKISLNVRKTDTPNVIQIDVEATFMIKNWGTSPARNISISVGATADFSDLEREAKSICGSTSEWFEQKSPALNKTTFNQKVGLVLFPGQEFPKSFNTGAETSKFDAIWLPGCIVYADSAGKKHTTRFCEVALPDGTRTTCHVQNDAN